MTSEMADFRLWNKGMAAPAVVWDAFKAHTRGQYRLDIGKWRRESSLAFEDAEVQAQRLETQCINTGNREAYGDLQVHYKEIAVLRATFPENSPLTVSEDF